MLDPEQMIEMFSMRPLEPEGGYYVETFRAEESIGAEIPAGQSGAKKSLYTSILYLLTPDAQSMLHRLPSDEIYHFYMGDPVILLLLHPSGQVELLTLGHNLQGGERVQIRVPRGVWQGAVLREGGAYALLGTTMAPGFDRSDYEAGDRQELTGLFPGFADLIARLTP
jgi:predicted cupin superfamily sugar epimerase